MLCPLRKDMATGEFLPCLGGDCEWCFAESVNTNDGYKIVETCAVYMIAGELKRIRDQMKYM